MHWAILRFNLDGSGLEVFAKGMRNPFGLEFGRSGHLWNTYHGADVRGSRAIYNDPDYLVQVEHGGWYGWPDYYDGQPVTDMRFRAPGKPQPEVLWQTHPLLARAFMTFPTHEAANGLAFSPGGTFGFDGDAFVAMFGTFTPVTTGLNIQPVGFRVVRVDLSTREQHDFASNRLPGPAYINQQGGLDRPSDLLFAPDQSLYVVDWGASTLTPEGLKLQPQSGVIWRIFRDTAAPLRPNGPLSVQAATLPDNLHKAEVRNVPEFYESYAFEISVVGAALLMAITAIVFLFAWRKRSGQKSHMRRSR